MTKRVLGLICGKLSLWKKTKEKEKFDDAKKPKELVSLKKSLKKLTLNKQRSNYINALFFI